MNRLEHKGSWRSIQNLSSADGATARLVSVSYAMWLAARLVSSRANSEDALVLTSSLRATNVYGKTGGFQVCVRCSGEVDVVHVV